MRPFALLTFFLSALIGGCSSKMDNATEDFEKPKSLAKLKSKKMEEISGLIASRANPGFFWMHNDSGNGPEIFLVNDKLDIVLTCKLENVQNRDWEDISAGPGPVEGKSYLYIGDIGDNFGKYQEKFVYRFEEPVAGEEKEISVSSFDVITFRLPDASKDTEALLLDHTTKDLYIISKREEPVWLYRLKYPYAPGDTLTAEKLFSLPMTQIVGGDISRDGKILLKNYEHIYYWPNAEKKPVSECLASPGFEVPYEPEPQGESIGWSLQGDAFYTVSEKNVGKDSYLLYYAPRGSGD